MANLPQVQNVAQISSKWKAQLDPILANLLVQGRLIPDINLINGTIAINHGLGRVPQGWFLVAPNGAATVYQAAFQPNPTLQLTLTSNAAIVASVWAF